jgi:hypothetical protein
VALAAVGGSLLAVIVASSWSEPNDNTVASIGCAMALAILAVLAIPFGAIWPD